MKELRFADNDAADFLIKGIHLRKYADLHLTNLNFAIMDSCDSLKVYYQHQKQPLMFTKGDRFPFSK